MSRTVNWIYKIIKRKGNADKRKRSRKNQQSVGQKDILKMENLLNKNVNTSSGWFQGGSR